MKKLWVALTILSLLASANARGDEAWAAYERGDLATALREYRKSAEQGHARSQMNLGSMYWNGQGVPENRVEAVKWYRKAAEQGDADSQNNLGFMYANGKGVPESRAEAAKWYRKAADQAHGGGQTNLASLYADGEGVNKNPEEALRLMKLAAAALDTGGPETSLGWWYLTGELAPEVPKDYKLAFFYSTKGAKKDHALASSNLAYLYAAGLGVPQDYDQMLHHLIESAENFRPEQDWVLETPDDWLELEEGVPQNYMAARRLYWKAISTKDKKYLDALVSLRAQAKDVSPPEIIIAESVAVASDSTTLSGRVTDEHGVVRVKVGGTAVKLAADGSFSARRYVPPGGTTIRVEATDEWGNRSEKDVWLFREAVEEAAPVFAALNPTSFSSKENSAAVALIIGIGIYKRAAEARYADRDAQFFADYANRKLGVPKRNIKVLINENADTNDIIEATKVWLPAATQARRSDIYVFFAGHGLASEVGDEVYLLPYSGIPELLGQTALLRSDLFAALEAVHPRSVTLFLDTCYSGTSREEQLIAARPLMLLAMEQAIPEGFTVFSATSMQQTAKMLPEAQHGLFSYYLMKGLEGSADANGDRRITTGELHAYILGEANHLRRNQTPQFHGDANRVLLEW
jgi:TPR repeat protein